MSQTVVEPQSPPWWHRLTGHAIVSPLVVAALLLLLINPNWKVDPDSVGYLSMARSLGTGHGLFRLGFHQWYYAPAYSVLISPAFWFKRQPFLVISIINVITAWALMAGVYKWFARCSKMGAGLLAALVGVNVGLWDVCREPRSETLFSALLVWTGVFMAKAMTARASARFAVNVLIATVLLVLTCLTRQVGVFLACGFVIAMTLHWRHGLVSKPRLMAALVPGVVASIAVVVLMHHDRRASQIDHGGASVTYADQLRDRHTTLAAQLVDGVRRQSGDVGRLLLPGFWGAFGRRGQWLNFNTILYLSLTVLIVLAWCALVRTFTDPLLWMAPFYAVMFVLWPFDQGTRFNVPMLPILWASVWALLGRWPEKRPLVLLVMLLIHTGASAVYLMGDASKVGKRDERLTPLSQLASRITDRSPVALLGLPDDDQWMMTYLLDRPVRYLNKSNLGPLQSCRWMITPNTVGTSANFSAVQSAGPVKLWQRR